MKSKWNLVIHQTYQTETNIWVGTLFSDLRKPEKCSVKLFNNDTLVAEQTILRNDWQRPFDKINDRFYQTLRFSNLQPDSFYQVQFTRAQQDTDYQPIAEKILAEGSFYTLPDRLSEDKPFVIASGSCFYNEDDNGATSKALNTLYFNDNKNIAPHVKFFTGDQVYLDIGLDSLSPITSEVRERIANDYADTWQSQRAMLRNGANWFLADDHEYWNNYPYTSGKNPYLWAITAFDGIKKAWTKAAENGVKNVQQIPLFDSFNIGNDISVCFADLRSGRDKGDNPKKMMPNAEFQQLIDWAENLTCPGIIVLPQPLLVKPGSELDLNVANFKNQYQKLLVALASTGHDIVCISGDVHFGRIAKVTLGNNGATLHEIFSSPMSNLTGIDGRIAAGKPEKLTKFPYQALSQIPQHQVEYQKKWHVSTESVKFLKLFSYRKTKEHFMTLGFSKTADGKVKLTVDAWRIRDTYKRTGLPKTDFNQSHQLILS